MAKIGPSLLTVYDRKAGSLTGYTYSEALANAGFAWSDEKLDAFLIAPTKLVAGTKMAYAGLPDAEQRADVIAYLKAAKKAQAL